MKISSHSLTIYSAIILDSMHIASNKKKSEVNAPQRRRRPKAPGEAAKRFCSVCGDKAENYNFGQISCESCKAFFRRNAHKTTNIHCVFGGCGCLITVDSRKRCPACRLRKCFAVGMQPDLIQISDGSVVSGLVNEQVGCSHGNASFVQAAQELQNNDNNMTPSCSGVKHDFETVTSSTLLIEARCSSSGSSTHVVLSPSPLSFGLQSLSKVMPDLDIKLFPFNTCQLLLHEPPADILPDNKACEIKLQLIKNILEKSIICSYKTPFSLNNLHRTLKERQEDWSNIMNQLEIFIRQTIYFARLIPEIHSLNLESRIELLKLRLPTFLLIVFTPLWRSALHKFLFVIEGTEYETEPTETVAQLLNEDSPIHLMGEYCTTLQELCDHDWLISTIYAILKCFDISEYNEGLHLTADTLLCNQIFFNYLSLLRAALEQKCSPALASERFCGILRLFQWSRSFDKAIQHMLENMPLNEAQFAPVLKELCKIDDL